MDTQTSVATKSAPATPSAVSSVSVIRAPLTAASSRARSITSCAGQYVFGATMRTSMPSRAAVTR